MKIGENFIDTLNFLLSETNFTEEFFIIYDKETDKLLPYILTDKDKNESLLFLAASINLEDKNKYYVIHSTEFPIPILNMYGYVRYIVRKAVSYSEDRHNENALNLNKFFFTLKNKLNLNERQMAELYETAKYYTDDNILTYDKYISTFDDNRISDFDMEYLEFQEDIFIAVKQLRAEEEIKLAMIKNIKENRGLIENVVKERLRKIEKISQT